MDAASAISALGSLASAIATVILAVLTAKYVRLTNSLVDEAKTAKLPNVYVDLEIDDFDVKLVIGNSGQSAAQDIRFEVKDAVPWRKMGDHHTGVAALAPIRDGLSYLAPGRVLKYHAGVAGADAEFFAVGSTMDFRITFKSDAGTEQERQFTIELHSYSGILYESFRHPEREVARAIRDAESSKRTDESIRGMFTNLGKRQCPACRKYVSSKARKCPKCQHLISRFRR